VKARLTTSARKVPAEIVEVGAGVLDISSALVATGFAATAPLPQTMRGPEDGIFHIQDPSQLWVLHRLQPLFGTMAIFGVMATFGACYLWSDGYLSSDGYLWSDSYLWTDSTVDND